MAITRKCYGCDKSFPKDELITYAPEGTKTFHNYCHNCYEDKLARERFTAKIQELFGVKKPGPRVWTERKRLMDKYGYTSDSIVECLEYVYKTKKAKPIEANLVLINPTSMEEMRQHRNTQENKSYMMAAAMQMETKEYVVPIKENTDEVSKTNWEPDDWLEE